MRHAYWFSLMLALSACGSDDAPGPGGQTFTPPPMQTGTGKPPGSTSYTCTTAADCGYWYCECADGFVVNSALCTNGYCMDAAAACPDACAYFDHGAWTGSAGGGPSTTPPSSSCGSLGSSNPACDACGKDSCCAESAACDDNPACLDYWDCAVPCGGDPVCRDYCDEQYPAGAGDYRALELCLVDNCSSECS